MSLRRSGLNPTSYLGVEAPTPPNFQRNKRAPTVKDYSNYRIGDLWLHDKPGTDIEDVFILVSKANLIATWLNIGLSGIDFLTGDSGGLVGEDVNDNINQFGTVTHIVTTGTPGNNTITWDIGSAIADTYDGDIGSATPAANILTVAGGAGIDTSGAGSTITIDFSGTAAAQYTTDAGVAIPAANNLNVLGGTDISTSGAGDTVTVSVSTAVATQYTTDAGVAVPAANNLNVLGGSNISTAGAGSTITITGPATATSAFSSDLTVTQPNVTGAGTVFTIPFDRTFYNIGGDLNTGTGIYTAPADGLYNFSTTVSVNTISVAMTEGDISFTITGTGSCVGTWALVKNNAAVVREPVSSQWRFNGSILVELDQNDTVEVIVTLSNGAGDTAQVNIGAGGPPTRTWFSGFRIA